MIPIQFINEDFEDDYSLPDESDFQDAIEIDLEDEQYEKLCSFCGGSGEGAIPEIACSWCGGSGVQKRKH